MTALCTAVWPPPVRGTLNPQLAVSPLSRRWAPLALLLGAACCPPLLVDWMSPLRLLRHLCPSSAARAMSAAAGAAAGADLSVVYVTAPSDEVARRLAALLVQERRLAACVNIVPAVTSVYEWEGEVHHDNETLLIIP
ncbi:Protein CutA [Amphibalanus amphitrite]|uniref:Protein CutA n=2 Tax=Amphibalanus amphitrite TaxID=1232801 RepID=A0A6A4W8D4_AMPAM|nr:Protein CutA [Amphibalanus amphitrite]